jgi:hypothetical protein
MSGNAFYHTCEECVVVITPHARKSWSARLKNYDYQILFDVADTMYSLSRLDETSGCELKWKDEVVAFVYFRRVWNGKRKREELEIISITPSNKFQSKGESTTGHHHDETTFIDIWSEQEPKKECFICSTDLTNKNEGEDYIKCEGRLACLTHPGIEDWLDNQAKEHDNG